MIEAELFTQLQAVPAFTALVGDRVYPMRLPPNPTLPAVTYQLVSTPRDRTQTHISLQHRHYRIWGWGQAYDDSVAIGDIIEANIDGAAFGAVTKATVEENRDFEPDVESGLFRRLVEVWVWVDPSGV